MHLFLRISVHYVYITNPLSYVTESTGKKFKICTLQVWLHYRAFVLLDFVCLTIFCRFVLQIIKVLEFQYKTDIYQNYI